MLFDFAALAPAQRYKILVATVAPRPIAWVVTLDSEGRRNAAPYSFFNAFAGDPPVVGIGIGERAPGTIKDTGANIRGSGEFVVNLVNEATAAAMNFTAASFPPGVDEIEAAGLTVLPSHRVRPPRIAESPVALECRLLTLVPLGPDRVVVLGEVLAVEVHDKAVLDAAQCTIATTRLGLIGRMEGRGWYVRATDRFELKRPADA